MGSLPTRISLSFDLTNLYTPFIFDLYLSSQFNGHLNMVNIKGLQSSVHLFYKIDHFTPEKN